MKHAEFDAVHFNGNTAELFTSVKNKFERKVRQAVIDALFQEQQYLKDDIEFFANGIAAKAVSDFQQIWMPNNGMKRTAEGRRGGLVA